MRKLLLFSVLTWLVSTPGVGDEGLPAGSLHISWTTPDGVNLTGLYRSPGRRGHWLWVLLHGLGSNKQEWLPFVGRLVQQGDGFLIYDARGHGESVHQPGGGDIDYRQFWTGPGSAWEKMVDDVDSGVRFLES